MVKNVKHLLRSYLKYKEFNYICQVCHLRLDWKNNSHDVNTLKDIFIQRCYSDYFPFQQSAVIVDIGAHKGYFTIFASKNTSQPSRFICLEPAEDNLTTLISNLKSNGVQNFDVLPYGIYSKSDVIKLYSAKSVNYSIFKPTNVTSKEITSEIAVVSLRDLMIEQHIDHVDFLKMDCEGAEYPALMESDPETLKKIKTISIEFHDLKNSDYTGAKLAKFMEQNDFKIVKFIHKPSVYDLNYGMLIAEHL